jgi:hypothetical protein
MHVGWRRQHDKARWWRGALATIGGGNWQVARRMEWRRHVTRETGPRIGYEAETEIDTTVRHHGTSQSVRILGVGGYTTLSTRVLFTHSKLKKRCDTLCRHFKMRPKQLAIKLSPIRFVP